MRRNLVFGLLVAACFSSAGFSANDQCTERAEVVSLCSVLSDATKYDGKEIVVSGLYRMVLHGSILMGSACPKNYVNLRGTPNEKEDKHALAVLRAFYKKKKNQFQTVDEVLRGTFRIAAQGQCFGQNCLSYEIEIHELICARPPKPEDNAKPDQPNLF
jgi:hypothetical protein